MKANDRKRRIVLNHGMDIHAGSNLVGDKFLRKIL